MNLRTQLLTISDLYCGASGRARGTVSEIILKRGSQLDRIEAGAADLTTRSFERAMLWFSSNWPDGLDWPDGVHRPDQHGPSSDGTLALCATRAAAPAADAVSR